MDGHKAGDAWWHFKLSQNTGIWRITTADEGVVEARCLYLCDQLVGSEVMCKYVLNIQIILFIGCI